MILDDFGSRMLISACCVSNCWNCEYDKVAKVDKDQGDKGDNQDKVDNRDKVDNEDKVDKVVKQES